VEGEMKKYRKKPFSYTSRADMALDIRDGFDLAHRLQQLEKKVYDLERHNDQISKSEWELIRKGYWRVQK
jgi:hypothetical protein